MATFRKSVEIVAPDSSTFPDRIANQLSLANASIGNLMAYVMKENAGDTGVYVRWNVPKNYVGTPKLVVKGILDGAPSAATVLAFAFTGLPLASNEAADAAFATQDLGSQTIGSNGGNFADEDAYELAFALTNTGVAVDDVVYGFLAIDVSVNDYAGNFLLTSVEFEYADA